VYYNIVKSIGGLLSSNIDDLKVSEIKPNLSYGINLVNAIGGYFNLNAR